jgi:hypothetical protein
MADPVVVPVATPDLVVFWTRSAPPPSPWAEAPRSLGAVGPVYFLYGGASVWVLVR